MGNHTPERARAMRLIVQAIFSICLLQSTTLLAQNTPCAAINLPNDMSDFQTYSTAGMSNSGIPDPGCAAPISVDIWFSVTIPASGDLNIATLPGTMFNAAMAFYSGPCNNLELVACTADDNCGNTIMPVMQFWELTPGQTYYIRIWPEGPGGSFEIRLTDGPPAAAPINMQTVGSATQSGPSCIQLTGATAGQGGCAWEPTVTDFTQAFTHTMVLNFGTNDANGADGICLVYQNDPAGLNACGVTGGEIGAGGILNSFIVEFDTWDNGVAVGDLVQDHIAVAVNGNVTAPVNGPVGLPNIEDGLDHTIVFSWDPATNFYSIEFDGIPYLSGTYDIINNCFGGLTTGYCGFTASTGGSVNVQTICTPEPPVFPAGSEAEIDTTICQGELYFAGGAFQSATGTYFDFFFTPDGCDSTIITNLTVQPSSTLSLNETVCEGSCITIAGNQYCDTGFYSETLSNFLGCDSTIFLNLLVLDPIPSIVASGDINCNNPIISLDGTGSSIGPGMTYEWTAPSPGCILGNPGSPIINVNCGGTYTLTVTHSSGLVSCSESTSVTVDVDLEVIDVQIIEPDTIDCNNPCITLDASGSTSGGNYTYEWTGPDTYSSSDINPVVCDSGAYTLTISNPINGCFGVSGVTVSSDVSALNADAGSDFTLSCNQVVADLDGSNSSSGSGISIQWYDENDNPLGTDPIQTIDQSGVYVIEILDQNNGCSAFDTVLVDENFSQPTANAGSDFTLDCTGDPIILDGSNSDQGPNILLEWQDSNGMVIGNNPTQSVNASGIYSIIAINQISGCADTSFVEVFQDLNAPVSDAGPDQTLNCVVAAVTLDGSGSTTGANITYNWEDNAGAPLGTSPLLNVDESGAYYFIVENLDNNCLDTSEVLVQLDTISPLVITGPDSTLTCFAPNLTLGDLQNPASPNLDYQWLNEMGNPIGSDITQEVNQPGNYTLMITDLVNGCTSEDQVVIDQNQTIPLVDPGPDGLLTCAVNSVLLDGSSSSSGNNFTYSWQDDSGIELGDQNTLSTSLTGSYSLIIENLENGCIDTAAVNVTEDIQLPFVDAGADETLNCFQAMLDMTGTTDITPGDFNASWTDAQGNPLSADLLVTLDNPGTYYLEVESNINGCINLDSVVVDANFDTPQSDAGFDQILDCNSNLVSLDGSNSDVGPDLQYEWLDGNNILVGATVQIDVTAADFYTLIVSNLISGCADTSQVEVQLDDNAPIADAGLNDTLNCLVNQVTLDGSNSDTGPNFEINWYDENSILLGQTEQLDVSAAGVYSLTVTDLNNGCTSNSSVEVILDDVSPVADAGMDQIINCYADTILLGGSSTSQGINIQYQWLDENGVSVANTDFIEVDQQGDYSLLVSNLENGCADTSQVVVFLDQTLPITDAGTDLALNCATPTGMLDGSNSVQQANISSVWLDENGNFISNDLIIPIDQSGTYILELFNADNGCSSQDTALVSADFDLPLADAGADLLINCFNPDGQLDGSSSSSGIDFSYQWTDESATLLGNLLSLDINQSGTYYLEVFNNDNGCLQIDSVVVQEDFDAPMAEAGNDDVLNCYQPILTLSGSGSSIGPDFSYEWLDEMGITLGQDLLQDSDQPGWYYLDVIDNSNGCQATDSVFLLSDFDLPAAVAGNDLLLNCFMPSGELDASASSIGVDFNLEWLDEQGVSLSVNPLFSVSEAGTFILEILDITNGCSNADTVNVSTDFVSPTAAVLPPDLLTCIQLETNLDGSNSSNGAIYTASWNSISGGPITNSSDPLIPNVSQPGIYELIVLNEINGCTDTVQVTVDQDIEAPLAEAGAGLHLNCFLESGQLNGSNSQPAGLLEFSWTGNIDSGDNGPQPTVSEAGTYSLLVTNTQNGCTHIDEVEVTASFLEELSLATTAPLCPGDSGSLEIISVAGGVAPYLYSIDGGEVFEQNVTFNQLPAGTYEVVIQDADGCTIDDIALVEEPINVEITLDTQVDIELGDTYQIGAVTNLPVADIASILWTPSNSLSCEDCLTPVASPLETTDYTVIVENLNGCLAEANIRILVDKRPQIYIPNVFSPNNNGLNDLFLIFAKEGSVSQIRSFLVFDRWGETVYEAYNFQPNDPDYGWDGRNRNLEVNPGVFVWWAEVLYPDGRTEILKGDVTVLK